MEHMELPEFDDVIIRSPESISTEETVTEIVEDTIINEQDDDIIVDQVKTEEPPIETQTPEYGENADQRAVVVFDQLVEEGVFDEEDKKTFDGTWDKVREGISNLPQKVLTGLINQTSDYSKDLVRFALSSPNITRDDLINFNKTYLDETITTEITLDTMDEARAYLENKYATTMKPSAARAAINALEDDGILLDEAKEEYEKEQASKSNRPNTEKLIAEKENEQLERVQAQTRFAESINNELNATGWKPTKINEIKQRLTTLNPLLTEAFKSPKALVKLVDFLGYYKDGDIDYSKFQQSVETPRAQQFITRMQEAVDSPTISTKSNLKNPKEQDNFRPVI